MKRHYLFSAFVVLVSPLLAFAQQRSGDVDVVRKVVEDYLLKRDPRAVERSLARTAKVISADGNGRVTETPISKPAKHRKGATINLPEQKIASIDVTEGGALVKVESTFDSSSSSHESGVPAVSPSVHVQYISLLKVDRGEWKIVSILMPPLRFVSAGVSQGGARVSVQK